MPRTSHRVLRWVLVSLLLLGFVVCAGSCGYYRWQEHQESSMRSRATAELDRLRVPDRWSHVSDGYDGPSFELGPYATVMRTYDNLPDTPETLTKDADQAARDAGWQRVFDVSEGTLDAQNCSDPGHWCWSRHEFVLIFSAVPIPIDRYPAHPIPTCPSPPFETCTSFGFDITYEP